MVPATWPHGPGRPGTATAAAVLGFVTGGLTALVVLGFLIAILSDEGDATAGLVVLTGLFSAVGLILGASRLLARRGSDILFGAALVAVTSLLVVLVVGTATLYGEDRDSLLGFVIFALPLPVITAVFARLAPTVGWAGPGSGRA